MYYIHKFANAYTIHCMSDFKVYFIIYSSVFLINFIYILFIYI